MFKYPPKMTRLQGNKVSNVACKQLKTISGQCPLVVTTNMILFRLPFRTKLSRIFFLMYSKCAYSDVLHYAVWCRRNATVLTPSSSSMVLGHTEYMKKGPLTVLNNLKKKNWIGIVYNMFYYKWSWLNAL